MRAAAVASVYGWAPLDYLALEEDDFRLVNQVLAERARIDEEREQGRMDYLAGKTASLMTQSLTKWLGKNLPKLVPRR